MTYHLGTNPPASEPTPTADEEMDANPLNQWWYKATPSVVAWLRSTYPNDSALEEHVYSKVQAGPVFISPTPGGRSMSAWYDRAGAINFGNFATPYREPPGAPRLSFDFVDRVFSPRPVGPIAPPRQRDNTAAYVGLLAGGAVMALVLGYMWSGVGAKSANKLARNSRNRRTSRARGLRPNSATKPRTWGEWAAANEAQIRYLLDEDIRHLRGLSPDEIAQAENQIVAWDLQNRIAKKNLEKFSARARMIAGQVLDDLEKSYDSPRLWSSAGKMSILYAWANEFRGRGIPYDFLEKELRLSQRDAETRAVLLAHVAIIETDAMIHRMEKTIEDTVGAASEARLAHAALPAGLLVSGVGEPYKGSVWERLGQARSWANIASLGRQKVLRETRIDSPIEANRGAIYALPERKAYPITSRKDAYHATQRLKQGRVKDEADAKRIIAAIKRTHPDVWREYLAGYPVSRIMRSKRKASRARSAKTSRRLKANAPPVPEYKGKSFPIFSRVVHSQRPEWGVGVIVGRPEIQMGAWVQTGVQVWKQKVFYPGRSFTTPPLMEIENLSEAPPLARVKSHGKDQWPPARFGEDDWRTIEMRQAGPGDFYSLGWLHRLDGFAPMFPSANLKTDPGPNGLSWYERQYRAGYRQEEGMLSQY